MVEKFLSCYNEVFNSDGSRKICGREKCIKLIELAEKLCPDAEPGKFGSTKTGAKNDAELHSLKCKLEKKQY